MVNDAFLVAIIEKPDDHDRRMAYADYLEDQGQVALSELVRLRCRRASLPPDHPEQARLKLREQELLPEAAGPMLKRRLKEILEATTPDPGDLRSVARRHAILPLYADMGGCFGMAMDGRLVVLLWDTEDALRNEDDARLRNLCLFYSGRKYPELRVLIPPRPNGSSDCSYCEEINRMRRDIPNLTCYCGGLGWLPPADW